MTNPPEAIEGDIFAFYEVVRIVKCPKHPKLVGKSGHIAGKSFEDGGPIEGYAVWLPHLEEVWSFDLDALESLGEFVDPTDFESGVTIRVSPKGEVIRDESH
ncbi:MAG: Imm31 family immunity protein [Caulobacter sp.]|nr:Imm31 family immunity protein [Caulobacter sp.]